MNQARKMIARDASAAPASAAVGDSRRPLSKRSAQCGSRLGTEANKGNEEFKYRRNFAARIVSPEARSDFDSLEPRTGA